MAQLGWNAHGETQLRTNPALGWRAAMERQGVIVLERQEGTP